jgi:hypothetical protein
MLQRPQEYESFLPVRGTSGLSNARPSGHISSPNKTAPRDASNQPPGYFGTSFWRHEVNVRTMAKKIQLVFASAFAHITP